MKGQPVGTAARERVAAPGFGHIRPHEERMTEAHLSPGRYVDYGRGANIAGFRKAADAMLAYDLA